MTNTFAIEVFAPETQFRKQVIDALDSIAAGTGIADNALTLAKLQQIADDKLLGNRSGSTANVSEVADVGMWGT